MFKGPSSESFGQGTAGGVINLGQKTAHLGNAGSASRSPSATDMLSRRRRREPADQRHDRGARGGDVSRSGHRRSRPRLLRPLGLPRLGRLRPRHRHDLTVNYLHQDGERMPEYGVPMLPKSGIFPARRPMSGTPITEFRVPRSNFYGKVDRSRRKPSRHPHGALQVEGVERLHRVQRHAPGLLRPRLRQRSGGVLRHRANRRRRIARLNTQRATTIRTVINYGGGNPGYDQETWGAQNITGSSPSSTPAASSTSWSRASTSITRRTNAIPGSSEPLR